MDRKQVKSSNIRSIGYDSQNSVLEIEFNTGSIYQYSAVPKQIYDALMNANSHGSYFNQNIKKANYRVVQVR